MSTVEYWFHKSGKEVASRLEECHNNWYQSSINPMYPAWVRNLIAYYSSILEPDSWESALALAGERGELIKMVVPQARSLVRQIVSLVTKQRYSFSTLASNSSEDVVKATRTGNAVINNIADGENLDGKADRLLEQAIVLGGSYLHTPWRFDWGKPYAGDGGQIVYSGKTELAVRSVIDVISDNRITDWDEKPWIDIKTTRNRWDMIAMYPELEQAIKSVQNVVRGGYHTGSDVTSISVEDLIPVYEAFHRRSPAMPQGRLVVYSDGNTVYYDGPNPYITEDVDDLIPIEINQPEDVFGLGQGFPFFSNLLPCQEMMDACLSALATNVSALSVQSVAVPNNAGLTPQQIGGMVWWTYQPQNVPGGGKPEPLQLQQSSGDTFKFPDVMLRHMTQISNLNSTIRGEPPAGLTAGTAIATVTTNALEFLNSFSKSQNKCLERGMGKAFRVWRRFAKYGHSISLEGPNGQAFTKEASGEDVKDVAGVKIQVSNPLMSTLAGRSDLADKLMRNGMVTSMKTYFRIIEGSPPSEIYGAELSEADLVASENEAFLNGRPVKALSIDNHPEHMREHAKLLNDPNIRFNGQFNEQIMEHIFEHYQLSQTTDPLLIAMIATGKMPQLPPGSQPTGQAGGSPAETMEGGYQPPGSAEGVSAEPTQDPLGRDSDGESKSRLKDIAPEMAGA